MANGIIQYVANLIDDLNTSSKTTYSSEKIEALKHLKEFKRGTKYYEDTLVYHEDKLYRVFATYTSSVAGTTVEDALQDDVSLKNLILVSAKASDQTEQIVFDGVATTFNLISVLKDDNYKVVINGLEQTKGTDYTIDRTVLPNTITFDIVYDTFDECVLIY